MGGVRDLGIVGVSLPRVDAVEKATGSAEFTGDLRVKGCMVGKVLRSPHAHARIVKIDTGRARRLAGVRAVVTFDDSPKVPWNGAGFPPSKGTLLVADRYVLADKARHVGDAVAAVAAADEDTAHEAVALIEVEYEPLPAVLDPLQAMRDGAPLVHSVERNIVRHVPITIGSPEAGLSEADYVFEDRYTTPRSFQCSLEPTGVSLAAFDASGRLTLWTSTQMPHIVRGIVAQALKLRVGQVRVIRPCVGGAFGSRLGVVNEPICALLAQKAGKPVKLEYSRAETFVATECRHPIVMELRTGVRRDGSFTLREMTAILDAGAYATHTPSFVNPFAGFFMAMYRCANVRFEGYAVYTNTPPCGAYRGYGNPQAVFAVESQVDDISRALGIDPLEMRLRNHPCKGEKWRFSRWPIESCGLEEALARGSASIAWDQDRGRSSTGTRRRGVGMAYMMHSSGARPGTGELSSAIIKLNEDGTANLVYSAADCGQGSATALSQIAAEEIGLKLEDVIIPLTTDTNVMPFDVGSHASRQTYSGGNAVRRAAEEAKNQILAQAAKMMDALPADLEIRDGRVSVKGGEERGLSVGEVAREAHFGPSGSGHQIIGVASEEPPGNPPVYAAQFAEVEVDVETGAVKVVKMAAAHDVGRAINPAIVQGQIEGAVQQGIGYALSEEYRIDPATGQVLHKDLMDYKLPTAADMPDVDPIVVEAVSETGPFGAKSVGESGLVPTAAAIGNAIHDAVGIRLRELPFTQEAVLQALRDKERA